MRSGLECGKGPIAVGAPSGDAEGVVLIAGAAGSQFIRGKMIVDFAQPSDMRESRHSHEGVTIPLVHAQSLSGRPYE